MKWFTVAFVIFIFLVIVLADTGLLPRYVRVIYDFPNGDKVGHFVLFGILNFLLTLTFLRSPPHRTSKLVAFSTGLTLALLIALEEFSQKYFANRTFDLIDLLASYLGLLLGGWVAVKLNKK